MRSPTTPRTTTRRSALRRREKTVADPGSLGIVIGGSGNGEQIAANKVPGAPCPGLECGDRQLAREHNDAQLIGIGGRMHSVEEALSFVDAFLDAAWSKAERHQRRIDILAEFEQHHVAPPVPGAPLSLMPEGHTLHRLARLHQRRFAGAPVLVSSPQGRFFEGASAVNGRILEKAEAWGNICSTTTKLVGSCTSTSGCTGSSPSADPMALPVGQVRMRMVGAEFGTDLRGPTACEVIDAPESPTSWPGWGRTRSARTPTPVMAWNRIRKSNTPIGALLMDQAVIAGIGNVYRTELLFRHGIDPYRPGTHIDEAEFDAMWTDLVELMKVGFRRGKIIVVRPEDDHGLPAYAPDRPRTYVYRRAGEPCRVCGTSIRTADLEGRNLFWCPTCQEFSPIGR